MFPVEGHLAKRVIRKDASWQHSSAPSNHITHFVLFIMSFNGFCFENSVQIVIFEKRTKTSPSWVQKKLNVEETVALVLVQIWGLRHVPDHEWGLASGLRALSMIATAGLAIAVSLWLPHSRCKPVSPASNGHQGSYGVVLEEVTRGYVGLPQQNTPSPFCTSRSPAKHLSVICKPLFWGISCQLIWVLVQKWLPWYLSTTLPQSR